MLRKTGCNMVICLNDPDSLEYSDILESLDTSGALDCHRLVALVQLPSTYWSWTRMCLGTLCCTCGIWDDTRALPALRTLVLRPRLTRRRCVAVRTLLERFALNGGKQLRPLGWVVIPAEHEWK